ncbi:MAG: aspartate kinase [Bacillota bacterium]|nr:aspartate kinase [Bacillota bacterium]
MGIKVAKFGGTSLADANQFRKVKNIISSDPERVYIVPSAPGKRDKDDEKITDMLYECHKAAKHGEDYLKIFEKVRKRFDEIVSELGVDIDLSAHYEFIQWQIGEKASPDYVASRGEFLCGMILAKYIGYEYVDAAEVIFFNEKGELNTPRTYEAVRNRLAGCKKAVIPGFYGSKPFGGIKTFSRGGSDISGSVIARAVEADLYENWTDVSGFLMADPRIVKNPKKIELITYRELRELSYMGATVLHEDSIFPVRQAGIPINVRNTNKPEEHGTMIVPDLPAEKRDYLITGIAGKKGFTVIAMEKDKMNMELGFARKVLSVLEEQGISIEHMPTGIDTLCIVVAEKQLGNKLESVIKKIKETAVPTSIEVAKGMALVATVGEGMINHQGIAAKLFASLADSEVNVRMIDQGSSEMNIIVGVEEEDYEKAVAAAYGAFVE